MKRVLKYYITLEVMPLVAARLVEALPAVIFMVIYLAICLPLVIFLVPLVETPTLAIVYTFVSKKLKPRKKHIGYYNIY